MSNPVRVIDALFETTMLCKVTSKALGSHNVDKDASADVNRSHGAVRNASKVLAARLPGADHLHVQLVRCQNELGNLLKSMSQPFEGGWEFLANAKMETFVREANPIIQRFKKLNEQNYNEAEEIVALAYANKGTLNARIPTPDEVRNGYDLKVEFRPIPDSANFRGLDENTLNKLREMHDQRMEAAVHAAETNTLQRFVEPLNRFIEGMVKYEEKMKRDANDPDNKDRTGVFRDTLVSNIKDLHDNLASWNISGDPRLQELNDQLASLVNTEPKQLRDDKVIRTEAFTRAQQVVANLNSWLMP